REIHSIENELIFQGNEKFVFHDSQDFEAGREDEYLQMKKCIADRVKTVHPPQEVHSRNMVNSTVEHCIPMDKPDRAIQRAEELFQRTC
ncbi:hypothetical protein J3R82DRAFT_6071, partial [Butyriboletus roseoflavus]